MANEKKWTAAQSAAIAERGRTLLLSAAAGSGKTATLTERVIQSLTDPARPADITRLLVVTFTNAAAGELRDRISLAITRAIKEQPGNARLARQLLLLPEADICTIDGFCRKLLREHADEASLSPDFRIGEENELSLLANSVMEALVNRAYEGEEEFATEEEFCAFADDLVSAKNEASLITLLIRLYEKTDGFPRGVAFYEDYASYVEGFADAHPNQTPWGKALLRATAEFAAEYRQLLSAAASEMPDDPKCVEKYGGAIEWDLDFLSGLEAASESYDAVRELLIPFKPKSVSGVRLEAVPEAAERYLALRGRYKDHINDELAKRFSYTSGEWKPFLSVFAKSVRLLASLLRRFDTLFTEEKHRRNVVSFSDLEHLTLSLLSDGGKPTPLAREIGSAYDAIYVDEYQDINSVQHTIFASIATERNRFMVGDIKQSIYGFRLAEPDIFAQMRRDFPPYEKGDGAPASTIFMSENFRCDKSVIDFVNAVFDSLLGAAGESIGYSRQDRLCFSKLSPEGYTPIPAVLAVFGREKPAEDEDFDQENAPLSPGECEPRWVACEIARLLREERLADGSEIRARDVAILLRSTSARAHAYRDALAALGIPSVSEEKDRFFLNAEVSLAISLLNVIDNPRRDIHLAALLASPLFRFTPEELVRIRRACPEPSLPLYDSLLAYNESDREFEKGRDFVRRLEQMRSYAEGMPIDRLLLRLFSETGLFSVGGADGKDGKQNLLLLYHFAKTFTASSFKGLYRFIEYLNEIIRGKRSFRSPSEGGAEADAVRIMTIHGSKGLEFPVCFVSDCGRSLRPRETKESWLFHPTLGFAMMQRDGTGYARVSNPVYRSVSQAILESSAEEELRLLYVALTRARERLYVTGVVSARTYLDTLLSRCELNRLMMTASTVRGAGSYLEWLLSTVGARSSSVAEVKINPAFSEPNAQNPLSDGSHHGGDAPTFSEDPALVEGLRARFDYAYPFTHISALPRKLSVSRLSPRVLDGSDLEETALFSDSGEEASAEQGAPIRLPLFYGGEDKHLSARRGTATHELLQFCSLEALRKNGAEAELSRLIERRFLSPEARELVRLDELRTFADSPLLTEMLNAKRLYRELRFNTMLPAAIFTEDGKRKDALGDRTLLVQGVIDCIFESEDGRLVLVDYKTDRVNARDRQAAKALLLHRHRGQLGYYALAAKEIFGRMPDAILLYSLCLGETVACDFA